MKKMKWVFCLLFLCSCFAGCTKVQKEMATETRIVTEDLPEEEAIVVGYSQVGAESDWRNANTESIKSAFASDSRFYLLFEDAQQKQERQIKSIRNFILQEVDYIVLNPIVETGWDMVLQEAKDAGIPVIIADRMVQVEDEDLYVCLIGSDHKTEGVNAGKWLNDYLEEQGRSEEEINIVTLQGTAGSTAQLGRTEGFAEVMKAHPNWNMLDMQDGDFTQAKGQEVMEYFLNTYEDIDVVISENDNMTFGAIDAIKAAGKNCGPAGEMIMISFDAVNAAFDAMLAGEIHADFECNPLQGPKIKEVIEKLEAGEEVEKIQYVEETYFDTTMDLEAIQKTRVY